MTRTTFNDGEKKILDALVYVAVAWKEVGYPYDAGVRFVELVRELRNRLDPEGLELLMSMVKESRKARRQTKKK